MGEMLSRAITPSVNGKNPLLLTMLHQATTTRLRIGSEESNLMVCTISLDDSYWLTCECIVMKGVSGLMQWAENNPKLGKRVSRLFENNLIDGALLKRLMDQGNERMMR